MGDDGNSGGRGESELAGRHFARDGEILLDYPRRHDDLSVVVRIIRLLTSWRSQSPRNRRNRRSERWLAMKQTKQPRLGGITATPGEKKMTREDACVLNHLAQLIAGSGALEIVYKGIRPDNVERLAREAVAAAHEKT